MTKHILCPWSRLEYKTSNLIENTQTYMFKPHPIALSLLCTDSQLVKTKLFPSIDLILFSFKLIVVQSHFPYSSPFPYCTTNLPKNISPLLTTCSFV